MRSLRLKIHTQIFIAIIAGLLAGMLLGENAIHIKFLGDIFITLLKMIIIPLILISMVTAIVSIGNIRRLGRIGLRTFIYYMVTTLLAVTVGLVLVNILKPGIGVDLGLAATEATQKISPWPNQSSASPDYGELWAKP